MLRFSHNLFSQNANVRFRRFCDYFSFSLLICYLSFQPKIQSSLPASQVDTAAFKSIMSNMACGYDFDVFLFRDFLLQYLQL